VVNPIETLFDIGSMINTYSLAFEQVVVKDSLGNAQAAHSLNQRNVYGRSSMRVH